MNATLKSNLLKRMKWGEPKSQSDFEKKIIINWGITSDNLSLMRAYMNIFPRSDD